MKSKFKYVSCVCLVLSLFLTLGCLSACNNATLDSKDFLVSVTDLSATEQQFALANKADSTAYVRFDVILTWQSESDSSRVYAASPVRDTDYTISLSDGIIEIGDFFYVCSPIDTETAVDMIKVTYLANAPEGFRLGVKILPDAISAEYPDQMSSVWGVTVDSNGNIQK